jgi:hypothetical protein
MSLTAGLLKELLLSIIINVRGNAWGGAFIDGLP